MIAKVIVDGILVSRQTRTVQKKATGETFTFHNFVVAGPFCLAQVSFTDSQVKDVQKLTEGSPVRAVVSVSVYRNAPAFALEEILDIS